VLGVTDRQHDIIVLGMIGLLAILGGLAVGFVWQLL
jgi:hypothetical protein